MKPATLVKLSRALGALTFAVAMGAVARPAQDTLPTDQNPDTMGAVHTGHADVPEKHGNLMGMHAMPATVNTVDRQTGVVGVTAGGIDLKVHFPPPAVTSLKAGDSITLHMGYSKP